MEFFNSQPFPPSSSSNDHTNPFLFANEFPSFSDFSNLNYDGGIWGFPLFPLEGNPLLEVPLMESFPTEPLDIPTQDVLPEGFCRYGDEFFTGVGFGYKGMDLGFEEKKEVNMLSTDHHDSMNHGVLHQGSSNSSTTTTIGGANSDYDYKVMANMETAGKRNMKKRCRSSSSSDVLQLTDHDNNTTIFASTTFLSYQMISKYFYMPITQAARELNVGLTLLKKRCRELGIPRWPHRKLMSLQTLIKNVQELEKKHGNSENGNNGRMKIRDAVELLESQKRLIEEMPGMQLEENTRRLRQACFKANYKKRRLMADQMAMDHDHQYHFIKRKSSSLSASPSSSSTSTIFTSSTTNTTLDDHIFM